MFRQEVMSQTLWSAAEVIGRIKVTITEGYLRAPSILPFMPLKNLATFAFQHAPLRTFHLPVSMPHKLASFLRRAQPCYLKALLHASKVTLPVPHVFTHCHPYILTLRLTTSQICLLGSHKILFLQYTPYAIVINLRYLVIDRALFHVELVAITFYSPKCWPFFASLS